MVRPFRKIKLKEKLKNSKKSALQMLLYTACSMLSTVLDWGIFLLCGKGMGYHWAYTLGKAIGSSADFVAKNCLVFKTGFHRGFFRRGAAYTGAMLFSLLAGNLLGGLLVKHAGLNGSLSKLITDLTGFGLNYIAQKKLVFRRFR